MNKLMLGGPKVRDTSLLNCKQFPTGRTPYLPPNQQRQCTEGKQVDKVDLHCWQKYTSERRCTPLVALASYGKTAYIVFGHH